MAGSVTNRQQTIPVSAQTTVAAATISGTGDPGLDGAEIPYAALIDANDPGAKVPLKGIAQDGTDSSDAGALQGTAGAGIRGWLSTLVSLVRAQTAVLSSAASATSSAVLVAANSRRKGLSVFNDSTASLYVAFAGSASTSTFTVKVSPGGYWTMDVPLYAGAVAGVWDAQNGAARLTETS